MALDQALHFLDELKDKYMHEVEKAIEDWDYQDFSPDKRTPLLENEISIDIADDLAPDANAIQQIKDAHNIDWSGLSRDEALADQDYGMMVGSNASLSFEDRVVIMATPSSGVQGLPDCDTLQRFLFHAPQLNMNLVAEAFSTRLQEKAWQIRSKTLVLIEVLLEASELLPHCLGAFLAHPSLMKVLDAVRREDRNVMSRERARKVMSLIRSNGANAMLIARERMSPKAHVRHTPTEKKPKVKTPVSSPVAKKQAGNKTQPKLKVNTMAPVKESQHSYQTTSPTVAAAALASWRRRSMKEGLGGLPNLRKDPPNLMPFQKPPTMTATMSLTQKMNQASAAELAPAAKKRPSLSRFGSGNLSAFAFMEPAGTSAVKRSSRTATFH
ncbi:hypothetical protein Poli38472_013221 [Pythium oligandrum]|uniref:Uncharacterized protein n=1 Tax=Pythium oligandrum TaxID=41045 RepID=A0A8K1C2N2_PYTOL|nr:hypothetical protein Poli38472_013221 [Pythium oligandrum]|eukprot:TMW55330.1 hypothetical protein Poli38472_013221 [Pythium oligandrum]